MVREWTRQAKRATGLSLVAPLVLLVAATAVASSGGLGGLGSVGQIATGPALPDTGVPVAPGASLDEADIVATDPSEPPARTSTAPPPGAGAPSATAPPPPGGGAGQGGSVGVSPLPQPPTAEPPAPAPRGPIAGAPSPGGVKPPSTGPADDVIEDTRGVGESLPGPLGPAAGDILDLLLPPGSP